MIKLSRLSILTAAIILALLFSAFPLGAVMAEGEEPAPPETTVAEEVPAAPEEVPPPAEETPLTVEEVADHAPEGVAVVPVDPAGEVLPIVEEATVNSYVTGDPIYCPGAAVWGDVACSAALPTIEAALAEAAANGSGTIYVAVDYTDLTPAAVVIDGTSWPDAPSWLNLIGGVDFSTGKITGKTVLNRPIEVTNLLSFRMENFIISGVEEIPLSVSQTGEVYVTNSDFSDNATGLEIIVTGDAILDGVKANNTSVNSYVEGGFVSMNDVSFSGNLHGYGLDVFSLGDLFIESSKFNNNQFTGLQAVAEGSLIVLCSQALNNVEHNGMELRSNNDIMLLCNKMNGNGQYGLRADAGGTIFMGSNTISGNGNLEQYWWPTESLVEWQDAPCPYLCPSCKSGSGGEEEKPVEGKTQVVDINVNDPNGSVVFQAGYATVFKLMETQDGKEREVQRTILMSGAAPAGSTGVYTPLDESELPAHLAEGATILTYSFNLSIADPEGNPLDAILGYMVIRFYLPEGFVLPGGMRLVIQYFDPATSSWTPMSTGLGGGMAYTYASKPGTYVLTMEPIK
jgi:hypothetical protein